MRKIVGDSTLRAVAVLTGATLIAQLVSFGSLPILTRRYSPEAFGHLAAFTALTQIVIAISGLRVELSIPNVVSDDEATRATVLAVLHVGAFTVLLAAVTAFVHGAWLGAIFGPDFGSIAWLVPVAVCAGGLYNALQFYAIREKAFELLARTRVIQAVSSSAVQIGASALRASAVGLVVGYILQIGMGAAALGRDILANRRYRLRGLDFGMIRTTYADQANYIRYSTFEALLQMGALQIPLLLVSSLVNAHEAGLLFLANRVMQLPVSLVGGSFAQTFSAEAASAERRGSLDELILSHAARIVALVVGPLCVLGALSWAAFPIVFGANWVRAGLFAALLCIPFSLQILASATGAALYVTSSQRLAFGVHFVGFLVRVPLTYLCIRWRPQSAVVAFALGGALHYALALAANLWVAGIGTGRTLVFIRTRAMALVGWLCLSLAVVILRFAATRWWP